MPFYGNITNRRNQFTYDKIYSSLTELRKNNVFSSQDEKWQTPPQFLIIENAGDEVYIGRYVLINYQNNEDKDNDINNFTTSYDNTVWQKVINGDVYQYVLIADLNLENKEIINDINAILYSSNIIPIKLNQDPILSNNISAENQIYYLIDTNDKSVKYWIGIGNGEFKEILNTKNEGLLQLISAIKDLQTQLNENSTISETKYKEILEPWMLIDYGY